VSILGISSRQWKGARHNRLRLGYINAELSPHCRALPSHRYSPDKQPTIGTRVGTTWHSSIGTIKRSGDTELHGDLGLIKLNLAHTASIFYGDANGYLKRPIVGRYSKRAKVGDRYCTGGAFTGEICGYVVAFTGRRTELGDPTNSDKKYAVTPLVTGEKSGSCIEAGDSGGPVYTIRYGSPGERTAVAKGIISGSGGTLGCRQYFTDLSHAAATFGGDITKRKLK
jgi:hypothetical protein